MKSFREHLKELILEQPLGGAAPGGLAGPAGLPPGGPPMPGGGLGGGPGGLPPLGGPPMGAPPMGGPPMGGPGMPGQQPPQVMKISSPDVWKTLEELLSPEEKKSKTPSPSQSPAELHEPRI